MNEHNSIIEPHPEELPGEPDREPPEPGVQVSIANQQSTLTIDEVRLRDAVLAVFNGSAYHSGSVSIAVVDDATIHEINRQYLDHDYPTDVLSFVLEDRQPYLEGELVVSTDTAAKNAQEYCWPSASELLLYVIHGALHLVGYRDKGPDETAAMHSAEVRVLQQLGVAVPEGTTRWSPHPAPQSTREVPPS
ncbi:MAG: rRNA maturation RNase YbeY [Bythopirellula sp.]